MATLPAAIGSDIQRLTKLKADFAAIIKRVRDARWTDQSRLYAAADEVRSVAGELGRLADQAGALDRALFRYVVSFISFLADLAIRADAITPITASRFLDKLVEDWEGECLRHDHPSDLVLRGPEVAFDGQSAQRSGVTMMSLAHFQLYYARSYGLSESRADRLHVWEEIRSGRLGLTDDVLHLGGSNNVVWFADEELLRSRAGGSGGSGRLHADRAYDLLALEWDDPAHWESAGPQDLRAKALLLHCPLDRRRNADAQGLRTPTAVEPWGGMTWVPRANGYRTPWPGGGGRTVEPANNREGVPEGVHGPMAYDPHDAGNPIRATGEVSGSDRANLLGKHGEAILERAVQRLKGALPP